MSVRVPESVRRQLLDHPSLDPSDRATVERFLTWCEAYAVLEETILGEVSYEMPVHEVSVTRGDPSLVGPEAEKLAAAATRLLELEPPGTYLSRALEARGARVFRMPLARGVYGAFFFAGETAPAFLVNAHLGSGGTRIALAHLYAHFLVDNDPYLPAICLAPAARRSESEAERFADAFAGALLAPTELIEPFLADRPERDAVSQLAQYLELPAGFVAERLVGLGQDAVEVTGDGDIWSGDGEARMPERLVALALEGMHGGAIDVEEFGAVLGLSREDAVLLLSLSAAPEDDAPEDDATRDG